MGIRSQAEFQCILELGLTPKHVASLKQSFGDQRFSQCDRLIAVDLQDPDGGPADGGAADKDGSLVAEVVLPFVAAGMEELGQLPRERIDAGDVRPLEAITIPTCVCEVRGDRAAAVFAGDDVVGLKGDVGCFLRQAAVFASAQSPVADMMGQVGGHAVSEPAFFS